MKEESNLETIQKRRKYFEKFFPRIEGSNRRRDIDYHLPNSCPACGYMTLDERCAWEICAICFWEDDGQDNVDANKVCSGPNGDFSLTRYRLDFFDELEKLKQKSDWELRDEFEKLDKFIETNETETEKVQAQINLILSNLNSKFKSLWHDNP